MGAIERVDHALGVSRVFLVPKITTGPERKWRMVFDLRFLNSHLKPQTCRVETLFLLPTILEKGDYCCAIDLSYGYFHLSIAAGERPWFGFRIRGKLYRYAAVPFGWSQAPRLFTDLMEVVVRTLRSENCRVLWYLDDLLLMGRTPAEAEQVARRTLSLLESLGLKVNLAKCTLVPTQRLEHLGMIVDTQANVFRATPEKAQKLRMGARELLQLMQRSRKRVPAKLVMSLCGLAQFLALAVPTIRMHLRELYDCLGRAQSHQHVTLSRQAGRDLKWLCSLRDDQMAMAIWVPPPTVTLATDASNLGWGAYLEELGMAARGFWTFAEQSFHITSLEMLAVLRALETFTSQLVGQAVRHKEDNQAVLGALQKLSSPAPELMAMIRQIAAILEKHSISLSSEYIRSALNQEADALSRQEDGDDWALNSAVFQRIQAFAHCSIDRFASATNARLPRFNSRWACPGSQGTDALAQPDWTVETNWRNPPWPLLALVVDKLRWINAKAVLVTPD